MKINITIEDKEVAVNLEENTEELEVEGKSSYYIKDAYCCVECGDNAFWLNHIADNLEQTEFHCFRCGKINYFSDMYLEK